jgi:cytochrome c oxidase subunit II
VAGAAAASNGGISPVEPVSPNGQRIADAYWLILAITGLVFVVVEGLLIAFVIRYRRRGRPRYEEAEQIAGDRNVEIAWTAVPVVLLAVIVGFVFYKLPGIKDTPPATASGGPLEVTVEAHQFYWLFRYPDGRQSINTLFVPVKRVVSLDIVSEDVAHSWWVPAFGGKTDAIPGRTNHTWFQAERPGVYPIRCAEFCGIQHALMGGSVHVGATAPPSPAGLGKQAFEGVCASCHGLAGQGEIGPAIATSPTLQDPKALTDLVHKGKGNMPAVGDTWDRKLTNALVAYVQKRFGGSGGG